MKHITTPALILVPRLQKAGKHVLSTVPHIVVTSPSKPAAGLTDVVQLTIPVRVSGFYSNSLGQKPMVWVGCALSATPIVQKPLEDGQLAVFGGFAPTPSGDPETTQLLDTTYLPVTLDENLAYAGNVSMLLAAPSPEQARSATDFACRLFELTSSFHAFSNAPVAGFAPWSTFEPYFETKL